VPFEEDGFSGGVIWPQITLGACAGAGILITNRGLIDLKIGFGADFFAHGFVDHCKHLCEAEHPVAHGLTADFDTVPGLEDLRLAVERKVVAVFAEHDAAEQPSRGAGVLDDPFRGRSNHRREGAVGDAYIFRSNGAALKKLCRHHIELFSHFFANAFERLRFHAHLFGLNDDLFDRQVVGQPLGQRPVLALLARRGHFFNLGFRLRCARIN
jgi:hypothetical protein